MNRMSAAYRISDFVRLSSVVLIYVLLAQLALRFFPIDGIICIVWPASGFALAVLLLGGRTYWPTILVGAFISGWLAGNPLVPTLSIAAGNSLEAVTGAWLLNGVARIDPGLSQPRDWHRLTVVAAIVALTSTGVGVTTLWLSGSLTPSSLADSLFHWWQGNTLGIILVTPLILVWRQLPQGWLSHRRGMETFLFVGSAIVAGQVIFLGWQDTLLAPYARAFLMFVFVVWGALRFGKHGVLLVTSLTAIQALTGAVLHIGYFGTDIADTHLFNFWLYMLTLTMVGMMLALIIQVRREAETAIRVSETRLKRAELASQCGNWELHLDTQTIIGSDGAAKLYGLDRNQFSYAYIKSIPLPEYRPLIDAGLKQLIEHGQPLDVEYQIKRADNGEIRDIHSIAEFDREKRILFGVIKDITQHKQVAALARQREIQYRDLMEQAADAIFVADHEGNRYLDVNQAACELLGYTRSELLELGIKDIVYPEDTRRTPIKFGEMWAGQTIEMERRFLRKDGSCVQVELRARMLADGRLQSVVRDITERKRAEEELRIAAATFESHEAILITDEHSNIIRVNQAFTEITGYLPGEVLGRNPRIMSSGRHDRDFYIDMWQRLLHEGRWAGEIWDRRKNGHLYPKWMTITAIRNERHEVTQYVAIFSDITARKQAEEEIRNLAFYDALTKLPNRRLFLDRFNAALPASARRNNYGATLFIDLDRFKTLNDTLGHECGDLLLKEVGSRIKSCVREMDTVARFGGDEFVVLLESVSEDRDDASRKVALVAEKIREALARPYMLKEHEHHSSPSIGICLFQGNKESVDILLEHADMAMYQAKQAGRNTVRFFDPVMQQNVAAHDALENDLHHAIALKQLQLHYQIQVDNENRPLGAEVLLRWVHPERGTVMPGQFIPVAEESSLIIDIGNWVLQTVCQQLAQWSKDDKTRHLTLTVNISAKQFSQPDFVDLVADTLDRNQADPSRLKMELSEKLVLSDIDGTMAKIDALKALGVRLAIDNFSTVYSSLSYLKQLSSDQLKIHQDFVQGITQGGNDAQLVQTIIDLAKSLDMNIFAEGVETEAQRAFLQRHDCTAYQGYLFSKPVSLEAFEDLLAKS